jgi:dTDP-4-amino-4,6-dideoxy-D-galactose acyltransferase
VEAIEEPCQFLPWDTDFFGHRIARVKGYRLNPQRVKAILEWCETHAIECVYFLADSDHAETVRLAEDYGFRLVDIRATLQCNIRDGQARLSDNLSETVHVRHSRRSDIPALQAIARTSYGASRFYFDPCFPIEACEALYKAWIERSCKGYADVVLVAQVNDQPVGYVSCHLLSNTLYGQIGLVGIGPQARDCGVGQVLVNHCLGWFAEHGVEVVNVVTQGRNIAAQRLYQRCGFLIHSVQLWYHKWMTDCTSQAEP